MPRIPSKNTKRRRLIEEGLSVGMSGSSIQKLLQSQGLGIRNKKLYEEIRSINEVHISSEKRQKSIPKKYRKQEKIKGKLNEIYRGSLIISSIPLHSTPFNRHYLGFRFTVFSFSKDNIKEALKRRQNDFLKMVGDEIQSLAYAQEQTMGYERIAKIAISNAENFNDKWFFAVEEKGRDIKSKEGFI